MKYAYTEMGRLTNGVMFFFEAGDIEIACASLDMIRAAKQHPCCIMWNGNRITPVEALGMLRLPGALDQKFLGIRFTLDEGRLLTAYLEHLAEAYPALAALVQDIKNNVLGASETRN